MEPLLITYATLTGNAQDAATSLFHALQKDASGYIFEIKNIRDVSVDEIKKYKKIIFGASAWNDDLNPDTEELLARIKKTAPLFSGITFALFGLGDRAYEVFCPAQSIIKKVLEEHGANVYSPIFEIDGYPAPAVLKELAEWAKIFIQKK